MSAWDHGALDNDPALDVLAVWKARYEGGAPIDEIVETLLEEWGDALDYGDSVTNMQVIALCALVRRTGQAIPVRLKRAGQEAINRELMDSNLSTWADPRKREGALAEMMKDLGGRRKKPKEPVFNDSSVHYKNASAAHADLLRLAGFVSREGFLGLVDLMSTLASEVRMDARIDRPHELAPAFLRALDRLMHQGIREKDSNLWDQAKRERRMMLAWYLGITSLMVPDEIDALLTRVEGDGF